MGRTRPEIGYDSWLMAAVCRHCGQPHEALVTVCPVTGGRLGSAAYTLVNDDEAVVGTTVGDRYRVRDILGQGSTGTVFGAVQTHFDREAAMKVLRPRYVARDTVQRVFHTEVRAAFGVRHPSLVEVFDVGTLPDGAPFFVMERLHGDTLATRLGRERFSIAAAVDVMMQLLSAMDAVHAREMLLRDLRPQNVFLAQRLGCRPLLKVLDLGLSSLIPLEKVQVEWEALRAVVGASESPGALAIPYYLSPERTRSENGLTPASDIFVAAAIFYEALTGQKPFHGSTWGALLVQIAQARPPALRSLRSDVSPDLAELVMRALSADARARPTTAREMQDELRAVFEGPRRASVPMRASPEIVPPAPVFAPPAPAFTAVPSQLDALYEDESRTDTERRPVDVTAAPAGFAASAGFAPSAGKPVDEASADNPLRTLRPPMRALATADLDVEIHVEIEHEPPTDPALRTRDEDEETETMQLTAEVRKRIEQMMKATAEQAAPIEDSNWPPPRKR